MTADELELILTDCEARGLVERVDGGWRLSAWAEAEFGAALRGLPEPKGDEEAAAA